jgi:maltose operon periplasmic protein
MVIKNIAKSTYCGVLLILVGLGMRDSRAEESVDSAYAAFSYQQLPIGKSIKTSIDTRSPGYQFPTGNSYFAGYRLPDSADPLLVTIKSYLSLQVFFPCALLLNEQFSPTRFITAPQVHYVEPGFIERGHVESTIQIDSARHERYLIVLTSDDALSNRQERLPGANLSADHWQYRRFVPVGTVHISVSRAK